MSNPKQNLGTVKKLLIKNKRELEEKLALMAKEKFSDDQVQDPGDQAISSTMELLRTSFQSTEIKEYNRIVRALEKIEDGSYGICVDCGNPISEKRLKPFPNAERCLVCQEEYEDKERMVKLKK